MSTLNRKELQCIFLQHDKIRQRLNAICPAGNVITPAQVQLLMAIELTDQPFKKDIANMLGIKPPTLHAQISVLANYGFIKRRRQGQDGHILSLTGKTQDALQGIAKREEQAFFLES